MAEDAVSSEPLSSCLQGKIQGNTVPPWFFDGSLQDLGRLSLLWRMGPGKYQGRTGNVASVGDPAQFLSVLRMVIEKLESRWAGRGDTSAIT